MGSSPIRVTILPGSQAVRHETLTLACASSNLARVAICFGGLAQLVRAPALQAGGHRFESYNLHHFFVKKTFLFVYNMI